MKAHLRNAYFVAKQYDLACSDLPKAIDFHTSYLKSAYLKYSAAFVEARQYDKSIEVLTNLLKIYPGYPLAYYNRAIVYMYLEKWEAAVADWDKYLSLDLEDKYKNNKEAIAARDQCMLKIKGATQ
ncbi:MAG: tetratricopeptide repeat protein [Chloroflexi bacterium]|jgi:tetratricopeptide (TPR) repeat protein|nr:tetratricopeptide repeat protein [Chloroflexota bacterium]